MGLLVGLLGGVSMLVAFLLLAGAVYQSIGSARDAWRFPPPGRMVDVGGHRLHVYCTGEGSPTVVMDSGLPGSCLSWTFVQSKLAEFTRVCSYDRAGLGWSDRGLLAQVAQLAATSQNRTSGQPHAHIRVSIDLACERWAH